MVEENFEGILKTEFHWEDSKALASQIRDHESLLRLKRRWLMDLPLSTKEQEKIEEILTLNDKIFPESFLREDDVSYEDIRTCVEMAFGAHNHGKKPVPSHGDAKTLISREALREIFLKLDSMTNKSLYSFVKILTGGVVKFEKTKWSMKKTITELLPQVIADKNDISKTKLEQISQLLQDPSSFRGNQTVLSTVTFDEICLKLDSMTDKSLYSFVKILTGGVAKFKKRKQSMKKTITELLPQVIADKNDISKIKLEQISQLLQDPNSFCENMTVLSTDSFDYHAAAIKVLDGLEDFHVTTLSSMHRKLRGVKGYIPSMSPSRSVGRKKLISQVREKCMKLLSAINEPSERLVGALGVAGLTLKLMMNRSDVRDFRRFPPEIEALQNDIVKAIHLLNDAKNVSLIELRKVQFLLNPNLEMSVRSLRMGIRNLLTEYLYECSDMDTVPDYLVEILDIINTRSQLRSPKKCSSSELHSSPQELMKEVIEKEVECVLTVSAQAKEVVLNLLPEHEYDEEFARAYMEDYEVYDTLCVSDDDEEIRDTSRHFEFHSDNSYLEESIGETKPGELHSPVSKREADGCFPLSPIGRLNVHLDSMSKRHMYSKPEELHSPVSKREADSCFPLSPIGRLNVHLDSMSDTHMYSNKTDGTDSQNMDQKQYRSRCSSDNPKMSTIQDLSDQKGRAVISYLKVQEACDITSMIAYRFVGFVLDKLAKNEGLQLCKGDRLYLNCYSSVPDDSKDQNTSKFSEMWKYVLQR